MLHGNMEDIAGEGVNETTDSNVSSQQQQERESRITIDYSLLSEHLKDVDEDDFKKSLDKLNKSINDLQNMIQRIQAPNMKV